MKQKIYKKIMALAMILLAVSFVFSLATPTLATTADSNIIWGGKDQKDIIQNNSGLPSNEGDAGDLRLAIAGIIKVILGFLGIIAVVIILYAGFKWMLSGGSEEKVGEAKKMLVAGLIGLVIILSAYALANFVIEQIYSATTTGTPAS